MKQSDNEFGNSHKEQEISGQLPQKPSSCSKGITYKAKDFEEINSLLSDPVLRAAMPQNIRSKKRKRNQAILWCIKEFVKIVNNRSSAQQMSLQFHSDDLQCLHQEIKSLKESTKQLTKALEDINRKKKWWNF